MDANVAQGHGMMSANEIPGVLRSHRALFILDAVAVVGISLLAFLYFTDLDNAHRNWIRYAAGTLVITGVFAIYGFSNGLYDWRRFRDHLKRPRIVFAGAVFAFGAFLLIAFLARATDQFSRLWVIATFLGFCAYLLVSRVALSWYLSRSKGGRYLRRAVIVGAGDNGKEALEHLLRFDDGTIRVLGFLDDRANRLPKSYRGVPLLGGTELVERLVRESTVDLIIMALPWSAHERIGKLMRKLSSWAVDIYLAPDLLGLEYADRPVFRVAGMNVLSLKDRPIGEWDAVVKRIEDLCLVIPAIILLSPLMAIVAFAIKLESKGPVLFVQDRFGFNNNLIKVYKFRSMYADMADQRASRQTSRDDPRVTRVGRIIRKLSIDELPQLFNVLEGSMSLVGPRPHATGMEAEGMLLHELLDDYASRHRVKPGITGWAQCHGWRGEADTRMKITKRVEYDLYYIENWSVFLDMLTLVKTAALLLRRQDNAY
ncbi:MAG: undecaprenyl-phosphate glucose phosphotransferase [Thiocapsa sp.]|nr:undecaprenyl-phosphate glucose phosphotransferase [Thiocapsa sp.]MCG6896112.1 undecaprenyl-phosphate glucose phosphotransferase [Thiocapsa sp.]